jgi:hypothetical protein
MHVCELAQTLQFDWHSNKYITSTFSINKDKSFNAGIANILSAIIAVQDN